MPPARPPPPSPAAAQQPPPPPPPPTWASLPSDVQTKVLRLGMGPGLWRARALSRAWRDALAREPRSVQFFEVVIFADGSFDPDGAALLERQTAWTRRVATPRWRAVCGSTAGGGDANEGPNAHARALAAVVRGNPSAPGHIRVKDAGTGAADVVELTAAIAAPPGCSVTSVDLSRLGLQAGDQGAVVALAPLVTRLDISWNALTSSVVAAGIADAQSSRLRELDMGGLELPEGVHAARVALASLTLRSATGEGGLRKLNLSHHDIDDSGVGALAGALRTGRCALEHLNLADTAFTAAGLAELCSALASEPNALKVLDLSDAVWVVDEVDQQREQVQVGAALRTALGSPRCHLTDLAVTGDELGDAGVKVVTAALGETRLLQRLDLSDNQITTEGAASLAAALGAQPAGAAAGAEAASQLQELRLLGNAIGSGGATAFAQALRSGGCPLRLLQLGNQQEHTIGDEGATALAGALAWSPCLTELGVDGNDISEPGATALALALSPLPGAEPADAPQRRCALRTLSIATNPIGSAGVEAVRCPPSATALGTLPDNRPCA